MATVVSISMLISGSIVFAEAPKTTQVSYAELSTGAILKNSTIKDLKETEKTLADAISSLENPNLHYAAMGKGQGTTGVRSGYYYEFAKMAFVDKLNYEAQLTEVQTGISKVETTINYSLQKSLADYKLLTKQIELYKKKTDVLSQKYDLMKARFEKGLITSLQLYATEYELTMTRHGIDKLEWQIKLYNSKIAEAGNLKTGVFYDFETPVASVLNFSMAEFETLLKTSKQSNLDLAIENAKMAALENEGKVIETYKSFILKSDIVDYQKRYQTQKNTLNSVENGVYKNLYSLLQNLEDATGDMFKTEMQLQLARLDYRMAQASVANNTKIKSELLDYELSINNLELSLEQNQSVKLQLLKRIDLLVNYGVYIAQ